MRSRPMSGKVLLSIKTPLALAHAGADLEELYDLLDEGLHARGATIDRSRGDQG
jgi:hypothetical protein